MAAKKTTPAPKKSVSAPKKQPVKEPELTEEEQEEIEDELEDGPPRRGQRQQRGQTSYGDLHIGTGLFQGNGGIMLSSLADPQDLIEKIKAAAAETEDPDGKIQVKIVHANRRGERMPEAYLAFSPKKPNPDGQGGNRGSRQDGGSYRGGNRGGYSRNNRGGNGGGYRGNQQGSGGWQGRSNNYRNQRWG